MSGWGVTPEGWRIPVKVKPTRAEAEAYARDSQYTCSVEPYDGKPPAKLKPTRMYQLQKKA